MKKVISLILISALLIVFSANVYATGVLGNEDENTTTITGNEYENAQQNTQNAAKNNSTTKLPQTGAGDFGLGILLIVCAGSAIFAYKKVSDYKGI